MLGLLLAKDLRRAGRNPLPWLINLALPLCITALVGLVIANNSQGGPLGRIRFAIVDEDGSMVAKMLRAKLTEGRDAANFDPVLEDRPTAMRQINNGEVSAVLIIPANFTDGYLSGHDARLELIKNPAEAIHPAVLEEMLGVAVSFLNASSRDPQSDFQDWIAEGKSTHPPLVWYQTNTLETSSQSGVTGGAPAPAHSRTKLGAGKDSDSGNPSFYTYFLVGMSGMFLLFLGNLGMQGLFRELRFHTFERYQTFHVAMLPFVVGKVVCVVVLLLLCSAVLLGGGGLVFGIHWAHPFALAAVTMGYAVFSAGLAALLVAIVPDQRRSNILGNVLGMLLAMAGACMAPRSDLPHFLADHITPCLPSYWFTQAARSLQWGDNIYWVRAAALLAVVSAVLIGLAVSLLRHRFRTGARI